MLGHIKKNFVSRPSAHYFWRAHKENDYFYLTKFDVFGTTIYHFSVKADPFSPLL